MVCAFMIPQTAVDCNARPGDLPQLAGEVGQSFGDFELLGAHCLAAPAADAGGGFIAPMAVEALPEEKRPAA